MIRLLTILLALSLPLTSIAYEGDYVWEVKFKKQLPNAEQGDAKAQFAVGEMYEKGKGTDSDNVKAFGWYLKAAKQGGKKASYKVGLSYLHGMGVSKNPQKALTWLTKSSKKGYARANFYIGEMHETGNGVSTNYDEALKYYGLAKDGGYDPAEARIVRVNKEKKTAKRKQAVSNGEAKRRSEAAAAAAARKRLAMNKKPRAQRVSQRTPATSANPRKVLLKGGWSKRNKPAEFLPSAATKCKKTGKTIECMSSKLKRNIGMADIEYKTKAIIFSIKQSGKFKISYRNEVTKVTVTDPEFIESGATVPVKTGWQDAEHKLVCDIDSERSLTCKKDKLRKIKFIR